VVRGRREGTVPTSKAGEGREEKRGED